MSMYVHPERRAKLRCRGRIDGRHTWIYVGGTIARCEDCGAEKTYVPK